jgi:hypothetical protein
MWLPSNLLGKVIDLVLPLAQCFDRSLAKHWTIIPDQATPRGQAIRVSLLQQEFLWLLTVSNMHWWWLRCLLWNATGAC